MLKRIIDCCSRRKSVLVFWFIWLSAQFISVSCAECEPDFHFLNGNCYLFETDGGSWNDGLITCQRRNAQFYTPASPTLHSLISRKALDVMKSIHQQKLDWWTSLNDQRKEQNFEVFHISSGADSDESNAVRRAGTAYWEDPFTFPWNSDSHSKYKPTPDRNCVALRVEPNEPRFTYIDLNCNKIDRRTGVICVKSSATTKRDFSDTSLRSRAKNACDPDCRYFRKRPWTGGEIFFEFAADFTAEHKEIVRDSMRKIEAAVGHAPHDFADRKNCISFTHREDRAHIVNYVVVGDRKQHGCSSAVGMNGGQQTMNVADHCFERDDNTTDFYGTVIHELMHVLGFDHEHKRPDRDQYIKVLPENLRNPNDTSLKAQFEKLPREKDGEIYYDPANDERYFTYDYFSLLHYRLTDFGFQLGSSDPSPTLEPVPKNRLSPREVVKVGQRAQFTELDIKRMRYVYCDQKWRPRETTTTIGGKKTDACDANADGLCYKLFDAPMLAPPDAASFCESRGYHLAVATPKNYKVLEKLIDSLFGTAEQCDRKLTFFGNWIRGIRAQTSVFSEGSKCNKNSATPAFDYCGSDFLDCSYADWTRTASYVCAKHETDAPPPDSPYCARQIHYDPDYRYYLSCSNNLVLKPWPQTFPLCEPLSLAEYSRLSHYAFSSPTSPLFGRQSKNGQPTAFLSRDSTRNGEYARFCTYNGTCTAQHAHLKPYLICRRPNTRPFISSAIQSDTKVLNDDPTNNDNLYKDVGGQFWLRGTVPYIAEDFDQTRLAQLDRLMQHISEVACIEFVRSSRDEIHKRRSLTADYVRFLSTPTIADRLLLRARQQTVNTTICESNTIGRLGGEQTAVLSSACFDTPNLVLGVLMNILGFPADVVRPDRDKFVTIRLDKARTEQRQLEKQRYFGRTQNGMQFDFDSVTMFRYMKNLKDAPFTPNVKLNNKVNARGLSLVDKQKLRKIYPCITNDCSPQYGDGNCYYYEYRLLNRTNAYHNCRARGMYLALSTHDTASAVDAFIDVKKIEYGDADCTAKRTMVSNWDPLLVDAPNTTAFTEGGGKCADRRNGFYIVCTSIFCHKPEDWPNELPSVCARPLRQPSKESKYFKGLGIKRSILGVYCSYRFFHDVKYEYHVTCAQTLNLLPDLPPMCEPLAFVELTDDLVHRAMSLLEYADFDLFGPYRGDARGKASAPSRKIGFVSRTFNPNSPAEYLSKCVPNCRGFDVAKYTICRRPKTLK